MPRPQSSFGRLRTALDDRVPGLLALGAVRLLSIVVFVLLAGPVGAQEGTGTSESPAPNAGDGTPGNVPGAEPTPESGARRLDLDRLLRVPGGQSYSRGRLHAGKDREAWAERFVRARAEVHTLEGEIEQGTAKLREIAPDDWGFTPGGGGPPTDPEVLALRAQLKRDRESLEGARRRLRDLEIEASLAGVPDDWKYREGERPEDPPAIDPE